MSIRTRKIYFLLALSTCIVLMLNIVLYLLMSTNALCKFGLVEQRVFVDARSVSESSIDSVNLWNIELALPDHGVQIINNLLVISNTKCNEVLALDTWNGNLIWSKVFNGPQDIVLDETRNRVYVYGLWAWKRELLALDNNNGEEIWINSSLNNERSKITTYVLPDDRVFVLTGSQGLLPVNPDTGQFGSALNLPSVRPPLHLIENGFFWRFSGSGLEARGIDGQVVWASQYHGLSGCCLDQVYAEERSLIFLDAGYIVALDRNLGSLLWKFDEKTIVSNIAVVNSVVYGLSDDGTLVLISLLTGEELGYIQFHPSLGNSQNSTRVARSLNGSQVVANERLVVIYFADEETLSVYELNSLPIGGQH